MLAMLIRYRNGLLVEAVILSLTGTKMRVALKEGDDVTEFRLIKDIWISEDGEPVAFDFTMAILAAAGIVPPADSPAPRRAPALSTSLTLDLNYRADRAN